MSVGRVAICSLLLALTIAPAQADQTISAAKLRMKRASSGKEMLTFLSKDPNFPLGFPGSDDDPSVAGTRIDLFTANGPAHAFFNVPPGVGKPGWNVKANAIIYTFQNKAAPGGISAVKVLLFKNAKQIKLLAKSTGVALGGLGSVGIRITTGQFRSCALFAPGRATIVKDTTSEFSAKDASGSPALADCSAQSLGGATCGNGIREIEETCDGPDDSACPGLCAGDCSCPGPVCGDQQVNQASEECDGADDAACPGNCQPSCVCPSMCGDGVIQPPDEECDGPQSCDTSISFDCRPPGDPVGECRCCSVSGFFCEQVGCCDSARACIPGMHFSGQCCFTASGHVCESDFDCCSGTCTAGVCCHPTPYVCSTAADCCSGSCTGGFCD